MKESLLPSIKRQLLLRSSQLNRSGLRVTFYTRRSSVRSNAAATVQTKDALLNAWHGLSPKVGFGLLDFARQAAVGLGRRSATVSLRSRDPNHQTRIVEHDVFHGLVDFLQVASGNNCCKVFSKFFFKLQRAFIRLAGFIF